MTIRKVPERSFLPRLFGQGVAEIARFAQALSSSLVNVFQVHGKAINDVIDLAQTNETNIATNTTDIATNTANIATNTTDIATNATDISTNASNISTNTTDIATNASNISTNTTDIATNASNISTNTSDIATNTSDIATNAAAITTKERNILRADVSRSSAQSIPSGTVTKVVFNSVDHNPHGLWDSANNQFVMPADAIFALVTANTHWASNSTGLRFTAILGSQTVGRSRQVATGEGEQSVAGGTVTASGQTFHVNVFQNSGGNLNLQGSGYTNFSILVFRP